jgi:hypothetical protein
LVYRYDTELSEDGKLPYLPPLVHSYLLTRQCYRSRRTRRRLQHVHLLAGRGYDTRQRVRAKVSRARHQHV